MVLGMDLGSGYLRLTNGAGEVVYEEPSVVACDPTLADPYLVGEKAVSIRDRRPAHVAWERVCQRGALSSPEAARVMLRRAFTRSFGWKFHLRPTVRVGLFSGASDTVREHLQYVLRQAGVSRVEWIPNPVAAAYGVNPEVGPDKAVFLLDIGAETCEIAVVAPGVVSGRFSQWAGTDFDRAVARYLRRERGLQVGLDAAERVKIEVGNVSSGLSRQTEVWGRDIESGLPRNAIVRSGELRTHLEEVAAHLADLVRRVLDETPPALADNLLNSGLALTGGGAKLEGLAQFLRSKTNLEVRVADEPEKALARGLVRVKPGWN